MPSVAASFSLMQTGSTREAYGIPYGLALCGRNRAGLAWNFRVHHFHLPTIYWKGWLMINELRRRANLYYCRYKTRRITRRFRRQINRLIVEDYEGWSVMSW